jgi:hypothetical protein
MSIGHALRSLSRVFAAGDSTSPTRAPRGLGDARKLSQRDWPTNPAGRVHTTPRKRVTGLSVVTVLAAVLVGDGCL